MDEKTKITLQFILKHSNSEHDLRWKMGKYIDRGDLSFLGTHIQELNKKLKDLDK